jgi:hypothetical protein
MKSLALAILTQVATANVRLGMIYLSSPFELY